MSRMPRSIRVAPECIPKVKSALRLHGFPNQNALAIELGLCRATITSFFNGRGVDYVNFVEISEKLGLDWHAIAYIEPEQPIQVESVPPSDTPSDGKSHKKIDWRQICRDMLEGQNQRRLTTNPLTAGDGVAFELDEIYVPLGLVERKQRDRRSGDVSPEQGSRFYKPETQDEIVQTFHKDEFFEQVLHPGHSKRIAIIGEPGAGKTTLLQKIATWIFDNTQDVPIWISLADLQGKSLKEYLLCDWLEAATRKVRVTEAMQEALGELFNSGRVWLLLDAVDEMVVEGQSLAPLQAIANQLRGWVADARVVMTCRLNAWDAGKNALEAFDTYRNLHLSSEQISEFVGRWFKRYPEQGEQLRATLAQPQRERIRDVIKNPLSLALLCRTWQFGEGELPDTRAGLYEQFVEEIYKWKQERFPTNSQQREELNQALGQLALQAIDSKASRFRLRHSFICKVLGNRESSQFQLALRLGWLNQVGVAAEKKHEAVYAFFHPTFQEYFAAQAIDDWHFFLDHKPHNPIEGTYRIFEPQWKEVIKLWLGREDVEREQKEAFIKALVEFEDNCKGFYRYRAYFLAAAGIAEFRDCSLSDEIVEQILKWAFGCFDYDSGDAYSRSLAEGTSLRSLAEGASTALRESDRNRIINLLSQVIINSQSRQEYSWLSQVRYGKGLFILRNLLKASQKEVLKNLRELFSERQEETIKVLRELLSECQDELICVQIARLWERINPGDPEAVAVLTKLKETSKKSEVCYLADDSLREFAPLQQASYNPIAITPINLCQASLENINNLLEIIKTSQDGTTRRQAVKNLEIISNDHIQALIEVLHITPWKRTRIQAIKSLEKIGINSPEAIKALIELLYSSYCNKTRKQTVKSLGEIGAGSPEAIKVLIEVLHSSPSKKTCHQAVISLGKIGVGNLEAIKALVEVLHSNQEWHIRICAVESLEKIGADSPEAIKALVEVLHSSQGVWFYAVQSLGKIGADNPEAIKALMEMLHSSESLYVRTQAAQSLSRIGIKNLEVITTWIELLRTSRYNTHLFKAYWNLWRILRGIPYSKIVSNSDLVLALKDCLTTQVAKNYPARYIYCYEILWHCAENMTYSAFYQAWHIRSL